MKKIIGLLALLLCLCVALPALPQMGIKTLTFQWEQPAPPSDLAGWNLYYGTASGVYEKWITFPYAGPPQDTYTADAVITAEAQEITYYFVLTAFDSAGNESDFSNEVIARLDFLAPGVPVNLKVTIKMR